MEGQMSKVHIFRGYPTHIVGWSFRVRQPAGFDKKYFASTPILGQQIPQTGEDGLSFRPMWRT